MENIFENAKFGDKFVCKNGEIAIFQCSYTPFPDTVTIYSLFTQNEALDVTEDGKMSYEEEDIEEILELTGEDTHLYNGDYDIVSRYQEPIDEEKLDDLAVEYENKIYGYCVNIENEDETDFSNQQNIVDIHDAYKAGYRKAIGE